MESATVLSSLVIHGARGRHLVIAAVVYAPLAVLTFVWPGLVAAVSRSCGLPPFDVRGFWDAADARAMVNTCGVTGRAAYVQLQVADLVYPVALGWLLLVASALLLRRFGGRTWPVLLPIVVMTILDYTENVGIWILLIQWPQVNVEIADLAGVATAVKRVFGFIAFSTPLILGVIHLIHRGLWRRSTGSGQGQST
jgi:hypothetical protein